MGRITKKIKKLRNQLLAPLINTIKNLNNSRVDSDFRTRAELKRAQNQPIHIVFVCHMPALWNMFDSVYKAAAEDSNFHATVVALPYRHGTLSEGQYKDDGVFEYLRGIKVNVISGYDKEKDEWLNPGALNPDYIFYQTPYRNFPDSWSAENLSLIARICYVPYGGCIYSGVVDETVNPISFFEYVKIIFKENQYTKDVFVQRFEDKHWFFSKSVFISGCPKLDFLTETSRCHGKLWRRALHENVKRVLWTPRWHSAEGNCHFFDYKQFFVEYCTSHQNVDFIFRPHPLSLQNFIKTGELSLGELKSMESVYELSSNMIIDKGGGYEDTFLTSDILVSDMSTILFEYFATGKPIIYTHRVDHFNDFGKKLSKGFYWVTNATELNNTLEMLVSGHDPLKTKREEIRDSLYFVPDKGSGQFIKDAIFNDYLNK